MHKDTTTFDIEKFLGDVENLTSGLQNNLAQKQQVIISELDDTCNLFISKFSELVNEHAPLKPCSKRKSMQRKNLE